MGTTGNVAVAVLIFLNLQGKKLISKFIKNLYAIGQINLNRHCFGIYTCATEHYKIIST